MTTRCFSGAEEDSGCEEYQAKDHTSCRKETRIKLGAVAPPSGVEPVGDKREKRADDFFSHTNPNFIP